MKKIWVIILALTPAIVYGSTQQPVQVKHLSVPVSTGLLKEQHKLEQQETMQQQKQQQEAMVQQAFQPASYDQSDNTELYNQVQKQVMQANFTGASAYEYYSDIQLPPIEDLFESARSSPIVEYHKLRQLASEHELKSVKRTWKRYFKLNADYHYGNLTMSTANDNTGSTSAGYQPYYQYMDQQQHWWSVGASVSFPLDEIFDRRNRIRKQRAVINQSQYEAEAWYLEQKLKIIEAYTDAGMMLSLIRIKSETSNTATQLYTMCQADFINGKMDFSELSRQKGIQNVAVSEYEQTRSKLYQAILLLETLTNYKLLNTK